MKNEIAFLFLSILLVGFVSANGLQVSPTSININKTIQELRSVNFAIISSDPNIFYNISFESNPYINFPKIVQLNSGESVNVTANITGTNNFNGILKVKGFFLSNLGQNFETHNIDIYYPNGSNPCGKTIVKGDNVVWTNKMTNSINLRNSANNEIVATLSPNSSHQIIFDTPQLFSHYFTFLGVDFTGVCTITALDTTGYVNDPILDASLTLNLNINFANTLLQVNIPIQNYTINYGTNIQDILTIRNIGNETARNIVLSSEWFSFNSNTFDLTPGQSRNVGYTITPTGLTSSNQTNQNYVRNLTFSGNFPVISQLFNIFVPFANINFSSGSVASLDSLVNTYWDIIQAYCSQEQNVNTQLCRSIISKTFSQVQGESNLSIQEQLRELARGIAEDVASRESQRNAQDLHLNNIESIVNLSNDNYNNLSERFNNLEEKQGSLGSSMVFLGITAATLIISIIIFGFIWVGSRKRINELEEQYY